jgi:tetratricopeptide (TPR) repeat protein
VAGASLVVTSIERPSAVLGPCSPLPLLDPPSAPVDIVGGDVPAEIVRRSRDGSPPSLLPYLAQDDYTRELTIRPLRVAVLANDALSATVALDLGGRVLSLCDRVAGRELLYVNPVVQPANLALRNAWISGGIEWNIGTRGHSPTTMDTLHAAHVDGPDGEPMLRLWEFERLRGVVFQVDLWLPPAHPVLLARTRIRNVNDVAVPMYWWTNTAVVAGHDTRVLAPATRAFRTEYPNRLRVAAVPDDGDDSTYPAHHHLAADFFYDVAPDQRPWIAAVDGDGTGIAQISTERLRGRKLFVWGTARGGRRWQEWLSHGGAEEYAEIQAGLAPTQYEHLLMPARAEWSWTEAFGAIAVDPARSHGASWASAVADAEAAVEALIGAARLDELHSVAGGIADRPPRAALAMGTGWGALERARRAAAGEPWCDESGTPFPDGSLSGEQEQWLALLRTGGLPWHPPAQPPVSYVGAEWDARLAAAPSSWLTAYHRGTIAHGAGDVTGAIAHYEMSLRDDTNAWSLRGLAEAARAGGRPADAVRHAVEAWRLAPAEWRLAAEALSRLLDDARPAEALAFLEQLPLAIRRRGRIRLLEAWAAAGSGERARAAEILDAGLEVADLREGERSVDQLWALVNPDRELPAIYDFRMH